MITWDRRGDSVIGIFSPRQVRWLRKHLTDLRDRQLEQAQTSITVLLDDLPARGGVIEFRDQSHRMAWIWALQDLRIALAARLDNMVSQPTFDALQAWLLGIVETLAEADDLPLTPHGHQPRH